MQNFDTIQEAFDYFDKNIKCFVCNKQLSKYIYSISSSNNEFLIKSYNLDELIFNNIHLTNNNFQIIFKCKTCNCSYSFRKHYNYKSITFLFLAVSYISSYSNKLNISGFNSSDKIDIYYKSKTYKLNRNDLLKLNRSNIKSILSSYSIFI